MATVVGGGGVESNRRKRQAASASMKYDESQAENEENLGGKQTATGGMASAYNKYNDINMA